MRERPRQGSTVQQPNLESYSGNVREINADRNDPKREDSFLDGNFGEGNDEPQEYCDDLNTCTHTLYFKLVQEYCVSLSPDCGFDANKTHQYGRVLASHFLKEEIIRQIVESNSNR